MIICPRCAQPLPDWLLKDSYVSSICPNCQSSLQVHCFPALYRQQEKLDTAQLTLNVGEACCYEHSEKRAAAICSNCGRFLCNLCEVPLGSQIFCPDCLTVQQVQRRQSSALDTQRTKYDSIALALSLWPLLLFYFVVITAPLSFILAIFAWRRPTSIVRRSRWRIFAALAISSLEMAAIAGFIVFVASQWNKPS